MDSSYPPLAECGPVPDRAILDCLGLGLYHVDDEGRCTYANPAALRMLGYEAGEVLGRNMHELIHHSHPDGTPYPQSACPLLATRLTGRPVRLANEVLWRKDGSFFTAEYSAWPLVADGRRMGSVVTLDVTDADFDAVLNANTKGTFYGAQEAARVMARLGGGAIVNMSSAQAALAIPTQLPYGTSKGAISQMADDRGQHCPAAGAERRAEGQSSRHRT